MKDKTRQMVYAALLTALAIIIPIQFSFLKVIIPPYFTATLASHVPMFMAMMISPMVGITVGIGSTLGFLFVGLPTPVVFRAATHILIGYVGAKVMLKSESFLKAALITAPLHGLAEALVVIPFVGLDLNKLLIVYFIGAVGHHLVDATIAGTVMELIAKAQNKTIYTLFNKKKTTRIAVSEETV